MLTIDFYRDGVIYAKRGYRESDDTPYGDIVTATHEWRINEPAKLTVNTVGVPARAGDTLKAYHQDGDCFFIGEFFIISVESKHSSDSEDGKIIAIDFASNALIGQASPGTPFLNGVNLSDGLAEIGELLALDTGGTILFTPVNAPVAGASVIKTTSGATALDKFKALITSAGSRWRVRPDIGKTVIEYGGFGEDAGLLVQKSFQLDTFQGGDAGLGLSRFYIQCTELRSVADQYNCVFAEGGTYGPENKDYIDLFGQLAPPGYTVDGAVFIKQKTYARLCKTYDENGNPYTWRRSLFVSAGSLAATRDLQGTLSIDNVNAARAELLRRCVALLEEVSVPSIVFNPEIPGTVYGIVVPGDKISLSFCDDVFGDFVGKVYVGGFQTQWDDTGATTTNMELSTRLEGLANPIGSYFEIAANPPQTPIITQSAYTVTVGLNGACVGSYQYPYTYDVPPQLSVVPVAGCAFAITSNTQYGFSISATPCNAGCQSVTVTITPS